MKSNSWQIPEAPLPVDYPHTPPPPCRRPRSDRAPPPLWLQVYVVQTAAWDGDHRPKQTRALHHHHHHHHSDPDPLPCAGVSPYHAVKRAEEGDKKVTASPSQEPVHTSPMHTNPMFTIPMVTIPMQALHWQTAEKLEKMSIGLILLDVHNPYAIAALASRGETGEDEHRLDTAKPRPSTSPCHRRKCRARGKDTKHCATERSTLPPSSPLTRLNESGPCRALHSTS